MGAITEKQFENLYDNFCNYYLDDGSNDEKMKSALKKDINYLLQSQLKEITDIKNYHKRGFNGCLDKIIELESQLKEREEEIKRLKTPRRLQDFKEMEKYYKE